MYSETSYRSLILKHDINYSKSFNSERFTTYFSTKERKKNCLNNALMGENII